MEPVTLRTPRLELSVPTPADVDAIFDACQDADIQRYTRVPRPYLREHADQFADRAAGWWTDGSQTHWAIRDASGFCGMIGIDSIRDGNGELGYWLAPPARGRGLASEAASAVADWALSPDGLDLHRLEWRAVTGNARSVRVAEKVGFRYEGTVRELLSDGDTRTDVWIASLLRTDDRTPQDWVLPG